MSTNSEKDNEFQRAPEAVIDTPPPRVDNKLLAIIAMNIAAFANTGLVASYRIIAPEFHAAEFNLIRNICGLFFSSLWCAFLGYNPIKLFPRDKKGALLGRCLTG